MLTRAFYAVQSNWLPTAIAVGTLVAQRRAGRGALPRRHVGDPARDLARERRRRRRAAGHARAPDGDRAARARRMSRRSRGSPPPRCSRRRPRAASTWRWTPCSGTTRSWRRSCRSAVRSRSRRRATSRLPGARGARVAGATLTAQAPRLRLIASWTRTASATSRSSPTSTTGSRRWPIGSCSSPTPSRSARCATSCSTRWSSSASAGSRSRRRRSA